MGAAAIIGSPHLRNSRTVADVYLSSVALSNSNIRNDLDISGNPTFNTWMYLKPTIVTRAEWPGISAAWREALHGLVHKGLAPAGAQPDRETRPCPLSTRRLSIVANNYQERLNVRCV